VIGSVPVNGKSFIEYRRLRRRPSA